MSDPVIRIDTHGAVVFLAGPDVYKVKRAVRYDYMDFSTLALREKACDAEIAVNQGNTANLYLGVLPISRDANGALHLGEAGEVIEWAVHLKRFDEEATLDRLAVLGAITPKLIVALARTIATAHDIAPIRDATRSIVSFQDQIRQTLDEIASGTDLFPSHKSAHLAIDMERYLDALRPLLVIRGLTGQVRRCHGDLHLGNVVMAGGVPVLFDALEFNEDFATVDVLYDLAFIVMDLCHHNLAAEANQLLNEYLSLSADQTLQIDGLAALPLFLSVRAAIRAKITAASFRLDPATLIRREVALAYFEAAAAFMAPAVPRLISIGGLSGTGKTKLAAAVAPALGRLPGAIHLRSDTVRKHMAGVAMTTRLSPDLYAPGQSAAVYRTLDQLAGRALKTGQVVITDATYQNPARRHDIARVAQAAGVAFKGLWLTAPLALRTDRIAAREGDASDATAVIAAAQEEIDPGEMDWTQLDATLPFGALVDNAQAMLN